MKFCRKLLVVVLLLFSCFLFVGCQEVDTVKHNIQKDANYFKTYRRMTFINLNSDKVLYSAEGYFSLQTTVSSELLGQQEIALVIKVDADEYKMHYFSIANNVTYVIEQIENTHTDPYYWEIRWYVPIPKFD